MKKTLCSLMATLMLLVCFSTNAFASSPSTTNILEQNVILNQGVPIGTHAEEDGILLEDAQVRAASASGLPFSMTAINVSNLITTYSSSGKNFTGGAFDGFAAEGLLIEGEVTHTLGYNVKLGACYYQTSNDTFYSVSPKYFDSGVEDTAWIPKLNGRILNFHNSITYYGHITNHNGVGKVSGDLSFSVSTDPYA